MKYRWFAKAGSPAQLGSNDGDNKSAEGNTEYSYHKDSSLQCECP